MGIKHDILVRPVLALLFTGLAATVAGEAALAAEIALISPTRGGGQAGFELDGVIQPVRQVIVAAQLAGNVLELAVKAGDRVKAGQPIARIDARDAAATLQRSDAGVAQAQAELGNARSNFERTRDLRSKGFMSQAALDQAETQWKAAQAVLAQAQAGKTQAQLARSYSTVVAPFAGVVLATLIDQGDLATAGRPIVSLYSPGAMRAVVQVGLSRADAARQAISTTIMLPGGQRVVPTQRTELSTTDAVSQTIEWRLDLPEALLPDLRPGQIVRVRFDTPGTLKSTAESAPLQLPLSAIVYRGELTAVYVAQGNQFVLRAVRLGMERGAAGVEVLAGLRADERVAIDAVKAGLLDARPAGAGK